MTPLILVGSLLFPQQTLPQPRVDTFYVQSWKSGRRQIEERKIEINLSLTEPNFETKVKDALGKTRYALSVKLVQLSSKERKVLGRDLNWWRVELVKVRSLGDYLDDNRVELLRATSVMETDVLKWEDFVGNLYGPTDNDASQSSALSLPLLSKRVVKVESFYVIFQVTSYRLVKGEKGLFEAISLRVEFKNTYDATRK